MEHPQISQENLQALASLGIPYRSFDGETRSADEIISELIQMVNLGTKRDLAKDKLLGKRKCRTFYYGEPDTT